MANIALATPPKWHHMPWLGEICRLLSMSFPILSPRSIRPTRWLFIVCELLTTFVSSNAATTATVDAAELYGHDFPALRGHFKDNQLISKGW